MNKKSFSSDFRMVVLAAVLVSGCGQSSPLIPVTGSVTLDGEPLPKAHVLFRPQNGRPSFAVTDANGKYALQYTSQSMGAVPGKHVVCVTTADDEEGDTAAKEILPSRYNSKSTLSVTVDATHRTHDFDLQSK
jgi:hypothetical protein